MTDEEIAEAAEIASKPEYPEGTYAIVEVLGHVCHIGRYESTEEFGQKFCKVWPIENDQFKDPILVGGASIYQFTAVTAEVAFKRAPRTWEYSQSMRALPAPSAQEDEDDYLPFDEVEDGFP